MGVFDWFRRKSTVASQAAPLDTAESAPGLVFARLTDASIRIVLFPGSGQADGGIPVEVPIELIPPDLRMPNTQLEVVLERATERVLAGPGQDPETDSQGKVCAEGITSSPISVFDLTGATPRGFFLNVIAPLAVLAIWHRKSCVQQRTG